MLLQTSQQLSASINSPFYILTWVAAWGAYAQPDYFLQDGRSMLMVALRMLAIIFLTASSDNYSHHHSSTHQPSLTPVLQLALQSRTLWLHVWLAIMYQASLMHMTELST
jgi:hypothetical protein